jgi:hypothetical protein
VDTNTQADKIIISLGKLAAAVQMQIVLRKWYVGCPADPIGKLFFILKFETVTAQQDCSKCYNIINISLLRIIMYYYY